MVGDAQTEHDDAQSGEVDGSVRAGEPIEHCGSCNQPGAHAVADPSNRRILGIVCGLRHEECQHIWKEGARMVHSAINCPACKGEQEYPPKQLRALSFRKTIWI